MIARDKMLEPVLAVCPTFRPAWDEFLEDWQDEPGDLPLYLVLWELAGHVMTAIEQGDVERATAVLAVAERWQVEGEDWVREAATVGFLEDLGTQLASSSTGRARDVWRHLGPESRRWWQRLDAFWRGANPAALRSLRGITWDDLVRFEADACRSLGTSLAPRSLRRRIRRDEMPGDFLVLLAPLVDQLLRRAHAFWQDEAIDGLHVGALHRQGPRRARCRGLVALRSDQAIMPFDVTVELHATKDRLDRLAGGVGAPGPDGPIRTPYPPDEIEAHLARAARARQRAWAFPVSQVGALSAQADVR